MCSSAQLSAELKTHRVAMAAHTKATTSALETTTKELARTREELATVAAQFSTWKETKCDSHERAIVRLEKEQAKAMLAREETKQIAKGAATRALVMGGSVVLLGQILVGVVFAMLHVGG